MQNGFLDFDRQTPNLFGHPVVDSLKDFYLLLGLLSPPISTSFEGLVAESRVSLVAFFSSQFGRLVGLFIVLVTQAG